MSSTYYTIKEISEAVYREKMSKFIAFAMPVDTVEQARAAIDGVRNKYHDARHVCWAYMIGADRLTFMLNDNGEPSGTAGKPILGQINSFGLTNIAVAVVRYFGGIKLGTSGLIAAYREATRLALADAVIVEKAEETTITVTFDYEAMNNVMKIVKADKLPVISQEFDNICRLVITVRTDCADMYAERFSKLDGVRAELDSKTA